MFIICSALASLSFFTLLFRFHERFEVTLFRQLYVAIVFAAAVYIAAAYAAMLLHAVRSMAERLKRHTATCHMATLHAYADAR